MPRARLRQGKPGLRRVHARRGGLDVLPARFAELQRAERLFAAKEDVWKQFHYSQAYLDGMKSQAFWDAEFEKIARIDEALTAARTI